MPPPHSKVAVEWDDAAFYGGSDNPLNGLVTIVSVGFLLREDKDVTVLAQSLIIDGTSKSVDMAEILVVPTSSVREVRVLE